MKQPAVTYVADLAAFRIALEATEPNICVGVTGSLVLGVPPTNERYIASAKDTPVIVGNESIAFTWLNAAEVAVISAAPEITILALGDEAREVFDDKVAEMTAEA